MAKSRSTRRTAANKALTDMGNYHDAIPLSLIQDILARNEFILLQEDGTEWSGLFCGEEGRADIQVCDLESGAQYYYLRRPHDGIVVDAVRMPKNGRAFYRMPDAPDHDVVQEDITKAEFETFHAMEAQIADIYDESTMSYDWCCYLSLTWYKMPSGRYEIVAYVS